MVPHDSFTLTPQRMRMITEAFTDTLETGLKEHGQIVVRDYCNQNGDRRDQ